MQDAWVWDMYRPARFVKDVRILTFKDVNVEELEKVRPRSCPTTWAAPDLSPEATRATPERTR